MLVVQLIELGSNVLVRVVFSPELILKCIEIGIRAGLEEDRRVEL